ncbi:bile acid:sodium symporter family protein [Olivibacter sp. CPCC 100613]|uniref:bile acid:sodium symporter family protein n=1 Tax=Olivibacter sp. CPCC 100613 TaxID=3079931 RepID=UPI002FF64E4F
MKRFQRICLRISVIAVLLLFLGILLKNGVIWQPAAVCTAICFALGIGSVEALKNYQYTAWIVAAVISAMIYPTAFTQWGGVDLRNKWLILIIIQLVMFGMGIQMSIRDFSGLGSTGRGVLIGLICHFSVMPLVGYLLTHIFPFEDEIAAGIILIGSCSSGLASNVMVYLARANLILSVTVTAMATLAAPFLTPLLMRLLAGTLIEVKFLPMMLEIIQIVIVPIGAALLHDYLKTASTKGRKVVTIIGLICVVWLVVQMLFLWDKLAEQVSIAAAQSLMLLNFFAGAFIVGALYHSLYLRFKRIDQWVPYVSMFGIVYFTTVTTAAGRAHLLQVGLLLFLASILHNSAGYFFGYWLARLFKLDRNAARTIAFEVGLQNGGMASGLAGSMGKLATVGLAAAVFSPWMNISGSLLANYWRKRPLNEKNDSQQT